jgi:O-antigen ligase
MATRHARPQQRRTDLIMPTGLAVSSWSAATASSGWPRTGYLSLLPALLIFSRVLADATVLLTALAFLWRSARERDWRWCHTAWFRLSLLLVLYLALVSAPLGYHPLPSFLYSLAYLRWPVFAAALGYWLLRGVPENQVFGVSTLLIVLFVIVDTVWQWQFGADLFGVLPYDAQRMTGPLRNPVPASFTLRLLPVALFCLLGGLWLRELPRHSNAALTLLALFPLFCMITGERMSTLLSIPAVLLLGWGTVRQAPALRVNVLVMFAVLALLATALLALEGDVFDRIVSATAGSLTNFATDNYGSVFRTGVHVWLLHPWTGVGLSSYAEYCDVFARGRDLYLCGRHPHNIYLHWLAEAGVPALLLFVASIAALVYRPLRIARTKGRWLLLSMQSAILFVHFWPLAAAPAIINNWFAAIVWCGLGWILASPALASRDDSGPDRGNRC